MDEIYILEGDDLERLRLVLNALHKSDALSSLRIHPRGSGNHTGIAMKYNEGMWSPTIGRREV